MQRLNTRFRSTRFRSIRSCDIKELLELLHSSESSIKKSHISQSSFARTTLFLEVKGRTKRVTVAHGWENT